MPVSGTRASVALRNRQFGDLYIIIVGRSLLLLRPSLEFFLRDDLAVDRHEGVASAAEFGALAVIHAGLVCAEPCRVQPTGKSGDLDAEGRHGEGEDAGSR